jgi:hypothetical protein
MLGLDQRSGGAKRRRQARHEQEIGGHRSGGGTGQSVDVGDVAEDEWNTWESRTERLKPDERIQSSCPGSCFD